MIACDASELDASEHKIGCLNGIIDLSDGSHSAPDRAARMTKLLNVEYDLMQPAQRSRGSCTKCLEVISTRSILCRGWLAIG